MLQFFQCFKYIFLNFYFNPQLRSIAQAPIFIVAAKESPCYHAQSLNFINISLKNNFTRGMRIISGTLRGRTLKTADGAGMRPAMGKTREALFSMLEARAFPLKNAKILDLFAGCGSLGFECLSRGAAFVDFVENGEPQCRVLRENAERLELFGQCRVHRQDVGRFLRQYPSSQFNLVFLDPPYGKNLAWTALASLVKRNWLAPSAIVIAELEKGISPPAFPVLDGPEIRLFGQTALHIWTYSHT